MNSVLLTGAAGFIGRNAIAPLLARGFEVHAVSASGYAETRTGARWHSANLMDSGEAERLLDAVRPTHLLHFAWYTQPSLYWSAMENFQWVQATLALARAFVECGGRRMVTAGTCAEYDWHHGYCSERVTPRRPATVYGTCKNSLNDLLEAFFGKTGLSGGWGRVFFLYGPHEARARLVPSVVTALLAGEIARCTHGNQIRDFLHVEDVASAFVALLDSDVTGAVNIASGRPAALRDVVLRCAEVIGAADRVHFGALVAPEDDPPLLVADVRRLQREVGWKPRYDLAAGLEQTVQWWQSETTKATHK